MATYVEDCEALIRDTLPDLCSDGAFHVNVGPLPGRVLESYGVLSIALYTQSLTGSNIIVNLMIPSVRRFSARMAVNGVGASGERDGVRYRFIICKQY